MNVIHAIPESKGLLTVETMDDKGRITGAICDKDGKPLGNNELGAAREVYMDSFSGEHFMRISHEEKLALEKDGDGDTVYQGQGAVHGWFVPSPDHTVNGRLGDGKVDSEKVAA